MFLREEFLLIAYKEKKKQLPLGGMGMFLKGPNIKYSPVERYSKEETKSSGCCIFIFVLYGANISSYNNPIH